MEEIHLQFSSLNLFFVVNYREGETGNLPKWWYQPDEKAPGPACFTHFLCQTCAVDHGQIKTLPVICLFLDCSSMSNQSRPWVAPHLNRSQTRCNWVSSYGEENRWSGKLKNNQLLSAGAAEGPPSLHYFCCIILAETPNIPGWACKIVRAHRHCNSRSDWLRMMNHFT